MNSLYFHPKTYEDINSFLHKQHHSLLLHGPKGAGKSATAEHIATKLLNVDTIDTFPYLLHMDFSKTGGIDEVRQIKKHLHMSTTGQNQVRRILILEHIDQIRLEAQNALLKTIEEPPQDTVIIMTAESTHSIIKTIISRCRVMEILPLDTRTISKWLERNNRNDIRQVELLSSSLAGNASQLISLSDSQLQQNVDIAKKFLSLSSYKRLCLLEMYVKDKELAHNLIEGLVICLRAGLIAAKSNSLPLLHKKLEIIARTHKLSKTSINLKLLLTELSLEL